MDAAQRTAPDADRALPASFAALRASADARIVSPALRAAATGADRDARVLATELLARLQTEAALPLLDLALGDRERDVRVYAASGLARHPALPPASREAAVLGAYSAASSADERAVLLGLLADTLSRGDAPVLAQAFERTEPVERLAACDALTRLAQRGYVATAAVLDRLPALLGEDPAIAAACLRALAIPSFADALPEAVRDAVTPSVQALAGRPQPAVAVPALAALPVLIGRDAVPVLEVAAGSPETRIAIEATRQLAPRLSPSALVRFTRAELDRELDRPARFGGARLHVLLLALGAAEAHPDDPAIAALADFAVAALKPAADEVPHVALGRARAHCAAARLRDMVKKWPGQVQFCGGTLISEALRDVFAAEVLARATDSDALRATQLTKLFEKGPRDVQLAALGASASLPAEVAAPLLTRGLQHSDPVVLAAAARGFSARAASLRGQPALSEALDRAFSTAERTPEAAIAWIEAVRAWARPAVAAAPSPNAEAAQAPASEAAAPSGDRARFAEPIGRLGRHAVGAVRDAARAVVAEWQLPDPGPAWGVVEPLPESRWPSPNASFHVKLSTTAGPITLELDLVHAPAAALRFVQLARGGSLDGLPVSAVTAGRAVVVRPLTEGGLPALRDEPSPERVVRGSVLLQDHGRDAVGPGFAIILENTPELDRRATHLGKLTPQSLDTADSLDLADKILEAQVEID